MGREGAEPRSLSRVPAVRVELALEARECRLLGSAKSGGEFGESGTLGSRAVESDKGEPDPQDLGEGGQSGSEGGVRGEIGILLDG